MPPITKATKITTAAKSSPPIIFLLRAHRVEQSAYEVDGGDRVWRTAFSNTERRSKPTAYSTHVCC
jgi:hypothetical protein